MTNPQMFDLIAICIVTPLSFFFFYQSKINYYR